jgi:hypothetical protein
VCVCVCVDAGFPLSHPTGPGKSLRERKKRERKKRKEHIQQANERKKTPCHKSKAAPCSTVMNDRGASDAKKTSKAFFFLLLPSSSYSLCIALDEDAICDLLYAEQTPPLFPANPPRIFSPPFAFRRSVLVHHRQERRPGGRDMMMRCFGCRETCASAPLKNVWNDFIRVPSPCFSRGHGLLL